jgi:hypothetical protein
MVASAPGLAIAAVVLVVAGTICFGLASFGQFGLVTIGFVAWVGIVCVILGSVLLLLRLGLAAGLSVMLILLLLLAVIGRVGAGAGYQR